MATKQRIPQPSSPIRGVSEAFDDLADAIATPTPTRPLRNAVGGAGRKYCDAIGALPGLYGDALRNVQGVPSLLCKPYWDKNDYDAPVNDPPFVGGQCATLYRASVFRGPPSGVQTGGGLNNVLGPITGVSIVRTQTFRYVVSATGQNGTDSATVNTIAGEGAPTLGPWIRQDGQPDNCGDIEGGLKPGANPPPTPAPFPPGQEPGTDPDGQPFFFVPPIDPIIPGTDPVDVPPLEPSGDGGSGGGTSEPPTGTDGGEGDAPGGEEPFEEPPPGERWVGCCVTLIEEPTAVGVVPSSGTEKIYTTVYGNLRLKFDSLNGSGYDTPIQIRARTTCVWEPVRGLEPTGVRINLNPGFRYRLTKYSVPVEN